MAKNSLQAEQIKQKMQREIKQQLTEKQFFEDYPTQLQETDIFELSDQQCIAQVDLIDEDGKPTVFSEVVKFFKDPYNGKYMRKYC